jgi:ankyrin repeat protein
MFLVVYLWVMACAALAQDPDDEKAIERGVDLVAAVSGQIGEAPVFGAGIVFAREKDRLYIATANHVVRQGSKQAINLRVRLRPWPDKLLEAKLLPQLNVELDMAALIVEGLEAKGVDVCALALDRLAPADSAKRGAEVIPIGNPNGEPWTIPLRSDGVLELRESRILFESMRLARGHSGGALLDTHGLLAGMIQADEPPNGRALSMAETLRILQGWNLPVQLRLPEENGLPPLFGATRRNDLEDVRSLIGQVCTNVNATLGSGETALHSAARLRGAEIGKLLLEAGAKVNALERSGEAPLFYAANAGSVEMARELIAHGADVNSTEAYYTPLAAATLRGHLDVVKLLLAKGADPNLSGRGDRQTPVLVAVNPVSRRAVHDEILRVLIEAKADVNAVNKEGDTPLTLAVESRRAATVKMLLDAGASVAVQNRNKESPFRLVTTQGYAPEEHLLQQIAVGLLEHSSSIGEEDAARLLVDKCARNGWADVTALIVKRGFQVKGEAGDRALRDAAKNGHAEVIRVLLEAGADPNTGGRYTPLQTVLGAFGGDKIDPAKRFEVVRVLVSNGAKVNIPTDYPYLEYQEPLYLALISLSPPDLKVAELLIAHGALVKATLIETARNQNRPAAVALLLKAGAQSGSKK